MFSFKRTQKAVIRRGSVPHIGLPLWFLFAFVTVTSLSDQLYIVIVLHSYDDA